MIIFLKNGESHKIDQYVKNDYDELRKKSAKQKETATFEIKGKDYKLHDIRFIGEWCHNTKCSRFISDGLQAHSLGEVCDYTMNGKCIECSKEMWQRDVEYSQAKFGNIFCAKHCPLQDLKRKDTKLLRKDDQIQ